MDQKNSSKKQAPKSDRQHIKIKSTVVSPPEPTAHPKDFESIEY